MRKWLMLLLVMLLTGIVPVLARQDDTPLSSEEQVLLDEVSSAFAALDALDTYQNEGEVTTTQKSDLINTETFQVMQTQVRNRAPFNDYYAYTKQSSANGVAIIETIILDEILYVRQNEGDWQLSNESSGYEVVTAEFFAAVTDKTYMSIFPFDDGTVTDIIELPTDTIDGQTMRVFEITRNEQFVIDLVIDVLLGFGGDPNEDYSSLFENSTYTQKIWIGVEDGLPHRVEYALYTFLGEAIDYESVGWNRFFGFDEPVTIENPIE